MKKYLYIFISIIFLLVTTTSNELFKFPLLGKHYLEHKENNQNLNYFNFFLNHYFNGNPVDYDYDKDMELPFKNVKYVYSYPIINFQFNIKAVGNITIYITKLLIPYKNKLIYPIYQNSIWRPPLN